MMKNMIESKAYRGRVLRVAIGIMVLILVMPSGAGATKFINDNATGGDCTSFGTWDIGTKTCTMTADLIETIQIDSNGTTLDGNGHQIAGSGIGYGVNLTGRSDVTIKNLNVGQFKKGIYLLNSNNNHLTDNTASDNYYGIELSGSSGNKLSSNNANSNNYRGFHMDHSNNNALNGNNANSNYYQGIYLSYSNNNTLSGNNANLNKQGSGIYIHYSKINNLTGNVASSNQGNGIEQFYSNSNRLSNNKVSSNNGNGIYLSYSSSNRLKDNIATLNNGNGIYNYMSNTNTLSGDTASNNKLSGIRLVSDSNTVNGNNVSSNSVNGIYLSGSSNNIYNNYFNNTINFVIDTGSNTWNIAKISGTNIIGGPYIGGNFWANPGGTGFSQTCPDEDGDGVCNSIYTLDSYNIDYLPLSMNLNKDTVSPANITNLTNITYAPTYINFTWTNPPDPDYHHVMLFLNSTFLMNITAPQNYYNITGLTPDTEYELGTHTVDRSGNINKTWVNKTARTAPISGTKYSISLTSGWNLISVPLMPEDTGIASVLSPINGNFSIVWAYNASDTGDHWKKYDPGAPFGNDLTAMEAGKGYWIMMTSNDTLFVTGDMPVSNDIILKAGWNLIGYNSLVGQPIENALGSVSGNYSIMWAYYASDIADHWKKYDPGAPFGNDLTDMEPGKGYWIMMTSDDILETKNIRVL